jgi:hypothetical protein
MPINGTVTMQGPAPPKGRVLYISTSNPDLVPVPPAITVPGGSATAGFTLQANNKPGSAGPVTISVSTKPPLAAKLNISAQGILSRGLDEPAQERPEARQPVEPSEETAATTTNVETAPGSEVTERGITSLQTAKPSTGIQSAIAMVPTQTLPTVNPQSQLSAAAVQGKPGMQPAVLSPDKLANLPSETKSAVITVHPPFGTPPPRQ